MSKIILTIKNGELISKVEGIKGPECLTKNNFLKLLGNVEKDIKTKEYYSNDVHGENNVLVRR